MNFSGWYKRRTKFIFSMWTPILEGDYSFLVNDGNLFIKIQMPVDVPLSPPHTVYVSAAHSKSGAIYRPWADTVQSFLSQYELDICFHYCCQWCIESPFLSFCTQLRCFFLFKHEIASSMDSRGFILFYLLFLCSVSMGCYIDWCSYADILDRVVESFQYAGWTRLLACYQRRSHLCSQQTLITSFSYSVFHGIWYQGTAGFTEWVRCISSFSDIWWGLESGKDCYRFFKRLQNSEIGSYVSFCWAWDPNINCALYQT